MFRQQKPSRGEEYRTIEMMAIITAYDAGYESTGKNPNDIGYGITASGKKAIAYHTIALPPEFPFGTQVIIDDPEFKNIIFVNEDRGGGIKIINDNLIKVDVYMNTKDEALKYGKQIRKIYLKIKN
jgi:3D (Asp-Asp-Asp) domain-containing protein